MTHFGAPYTDDDLKFFGHGSDETEKISISHQASREARDYIYIDQPHDAFDVLNEAILSENANAHVYFMAAKIAYGLENKDRAFRLLRQGLDTNKNNNYILQFLGDLYAETQDWESALLCYALTYKAESETFKKRPDKAPPCKAFSKMCTTLRAMGHHEKALKAAEECIRLDNTDVVGYDLKCRCLRDLGRMDEALAAAEECIRLNNIDVVGYGLKCQCLMNLGNYQDALKTLENLEELSGSNNYALLLRGRMAILKNDQTTAFKVCNAFGNKPFHPTHFLFFRCVAAAYPNYKGMYLNLLDQYRKEGRCLGSLFDLRDGEDAQDALRHLDRGLSERDFAGRFSRSPIFAQDSLIPRPINNTAADVATGSKGSRWRAHSAPAPELKTP